MEDIDELVRTRIIVLRAANKLSDDEDMSVVEEESYAYYRRALETGEHIAYLVIIDDSIVRGTTLKQSIIKILDRLHPKKIIIVSSSPQVRFPDCYGIDMSRMGEFIAFKAAIELLNDRGMQHIIEDVYNKSKAQQNFPKEQITNYVKEIYAPFTQKEISKKIARMLTSEDITSQVEIIYQTLEGLHQAIPNHPGDWYFSGNYPTPGGNRLVNNAFINFVEGIDNKRQL